MAEFGNGLAEESLLDSDPGHPELEDPGVGDEEPGLDEGEAAIEDPVSSRRYSSISSCYLTATRLFLELHRESHA